MAKTTAKGLVLAALGWAADGQPKTLPAEIRALPVRKQAKVVRAAAQVGKAARQAAERAAK